MVGSLLIEFIPEKQGVQNTSSGTEEFLYGSTPSAVVEVRDGISTTSAASGRPMKMRIQHKQCV